ncbi:MAG: HD domain-containing protein [Sedimentisphaerales bacterium]|nr:HD domain-containing protein [Sedimentisphaerales bacterium]NLZ05589.1 HD domain-containing protein [Phycisphaerae bacterium]HNY77168.1 HD domain-containing protein [Sedimentisphaerales bacterium]HOC62416.1 HD domain-containing protein [Sedimentisphaerales bacterium]HPY50446.1 HD domain-containing protein [Sedimentisphaerales bacterium]
MSGFRRSERELFPGKHATIGTHGRQVSEDEDDFRTDFQRDVHRIIYSQSFRRLRHKTQVFYFPQNDHVSTRMDHVRFVASASRTVARCLRLNEDLAEAIGLAHDIGHAPFGHQGETFLSAIIDSCQCPELKRRMPTFSHEVYGLRVVDAIAKRDREPPGLNLTWEVRDGIVSHCGEDFKTCRLEPAGNEKDLDRIQTRADAGNPATLEGCIVRLIDKIAYAGKDMEDALEAGLIGTEQVPVNIRERLGMTNGQIVRTLVGDMVRESSGKDYIAISPDLGSLLHDLIEFNSRHIYHSPQAEGYKSQAGKTIQYLFDDLRKELRARKRFTSDRYPPREKKDDSVPLPYRILEQFVTQDMKDVYRADDPDELIVLDFVAGMTDSFAIRSVSDVFIPRMTV